MYILVLKTMKSKTHKSLISIVIIFILVACQNKPSSSVEGKRQLLNIEGANQDIKESIGIDLLHYKLKIDKAFPADSFYVEVCENILFNTGQSNIYEKFGPISTFDNGDSILFDQQDTLFVRIFHSLADNIYLNDCNSSSSDITFCRAKIRIHNSFKSVNRAFELATSTTIGDIYDQFREGFLQYDELAYLCIVHHLIRDIDRIEK